MNKFLVVDDEKSFERLILQRFRKEIDSKNFYFYFAGNGVQALEILSAHDDLDVIISDINMPEMDGITLLDHIQKVNPIVKTIMVSAFGDLRNIRITMNKGAFDFLTKPIDFDDLKATMAKTVRHVSEIRKSLTVINENNLLRMYVNPSIFPYLTSNAKTNSKNALKKKTGLANFTERIDASVAFVDICKFTSLSESFPPDFITELLNRYFDVMAESIMKYDGIIDKFIGDAVLAVFKDDNHAERAVRAINETVLTIRELAQTDLFKDLKYPHVSAGIHCGRMLIGNYGSPGIGRLDFSVIGDVVNTAAAIEYLAPPGYLFVHKDVAERIKGKIPLKSVGTHKIKTKKVPMELFVVNTAVPE